MNLCPLTWWTLRRTAPCRFLGRIRCRNTRSSFSVEPVAAANTHTHTKETNNCAWAALFDVGRHWKHVDTGWRQNTLQLWGTLRFYCSFPPSFSVFVCPALPVSLCFNYRRFSQRSSRDFNYCLTLLNKKTGYSAVYSKTGSWEETLTDHQSRMGEFVLCQ